MNKTIVNDSRLSSLFKREKKKIYSKEFKRDNLQRNLCKKKLNFNEFPFFLRNLY